MVVILMGLAGTGKSTIGTLLARRLGCPFLDADSLHPPESIAKMASGVPLDDTDRWPWLDRIQTRIAAAHVAGDDLVVACSALKRSYRQRLAAGIPSVRWIYLTGSKALIEERLRERPSHFMKASMLESQLEALEEPDPSEALFIDTASEPSEIVERIVQWLERR
jgi:gluconokinase